MATGEEWAKGYFRQAEADFRTFQHIQTAPVSECHKLQFLQMACEKLVKGHLCTTGSSTESIQTSHAFIEKTLPVVLRQTMIELNYPRRSARELLKYVKQLAGEIEVLAPSVDRDGKRPDNCEYPWEDRNAVLHSPLDWSFEPSRLLVVPRGRTFLKLVLAAIERSTA